MHYSVFVFYHNRRQEESSLPLINASSLAQELVSIDTITLGGMSTDATAIESVSVQQISVYGSQCYDAIVEFSDVAEDTGYGLHAEINTNWFASIDSTLNATTIMALFVGTASSTESTTTAWTEAMPSGCDGLEDSDIVPSMSEYALDTDTAAVGIFYTTFGALTSSDGRYCRFLINSPT